MILYKVATLLPLSLSILYLICLLIIIFPPSVLITVSQFVIRLLPLNVSSLQCA